MKRTRRRKEKRTTTRSILRLPDPEAAKSAVLNSLSCPDAQRGMQLMNSLSGTALSRGCAILREVNWSKFSFSSGTSPFKRPSNTSAASSAFVPPSTTGSASNPQAQAPRPVCRPSACRCHNFPKPMGK